MDGSRVACGNFKYARMQQSLHMIFTLGSLYFGSQDPSKVRPRTIENKVRSRAETSSYSTSPHENLSCRCHDHEPRRVLTPSLTVALRMAQMLFIDGSVLEGGGQILRNATSLSALLSKPITIKNVRAGRRPPGLKNQHRTGIELAARICGAQTSGVKNGSTEVVFTPGNINLGGEYYADPQTAGAATLLLQVSLPLLLFSNSGSQSGVAPSVLKLKGGTNADHAPQIDYIQHVFLPFAKRHFGLSVELDIRRRGYFPKGGGEVHVSVTPTQHLTPASVMERGNVTAIRGIAHVAGLPAHLANKMRDAAVARFRQHPNSSSSLIPESTLIEIESTRENSPGAGSGIVLWAELSGGGIIGGSAVGSKQKDVAVVGEEAADELIRGLEDGGVVDEYLQDQIIILMALASSERASEILCGKSGLSLHTQTAIWVAEQLTDAKFQVSVTDSGHTVVRCTGIGYTAPGGEE
ncbi:RNA terminal phosphate cyclase domain 1 [Mycena chlorophos]|uniref:RNA 3'-terminal-phosphate cyclase (ATP) n=1 Tax=Mycena chlorophos TaxID=658473 RepID=A0A8H6TT71_MYCCL|nr:RNA terminal phosphate cyclase domain 1 [Mycena chlorophos]